MVLFDLGVIHINKMLLILMLVCFLVCGLCGCESFAPSSDNPVSQIDWSMVDRITVVRDRGVQTSWEVTDKDDVVTICELFMDAEYGQEQPGGSAGSYLWLKCFDGDVLLGTIILESPDCVQYVAEGTIVVRPMVKGAWSESQWELFLDRISE